MMSNMKNKFALGFVVLHALSSVAWAEHGPGNGGNAVLMEDGKYYLLDFVEAGIEKGMTDSCGGLMDLDGNYELRVGKWASANLKMFPEAERESIAGYLTQIEATSPFYSTLILSSILMHEWKFVNYPLKDIAVTDSSITFPSEKIHQLAVRRGRSILIQNSIWDLLDPWNRAGLVFHEALFALSSVEVDSGGFSLQPSWNVRQIVSDLFTAFGTGCFMGGSSIQRALRFMVGDHSVLPYMGESDPQGRGGNPFGPSRTDGGRFLFGMRRSVSIQAPQHPAQVFSVIGNEYRPLWEMQVNAVCTEARSGFEVELGVVNEAYAVRFSSYERPEGTFDHLTVAPASGTDFNSSLDEKPKRIHPLTPEECVKDSMRHYDHQASEYEAMVHRAEIR